MRVQSAKSKGRRLQQWVRDKILEYFPELTENDVRSTSMGASGEDVLLSQAAIDLFPYAVECKNVEKLNIWSALEQAEANRCDKTPLLVFKRNRSKTYIAVEAEHFMILTKQIPRAVVSDKKERLDDNDKS
jgi:hypothetical protein